MLSRLTHPRTLCWLPRTAGPLTAAPASFSALPAGSMQVPLRQDPQFAARRCRRPLAAPPPTSDRAGHAVTCGLGVATGPAPTAGRLAIDRTRPGARRARAAPPGRSCGRGRECERRPGCGPGDRCRLPGCQRESEGFGSPRVTVRPVTAWKGSGSTNSVSHRLANAASE